MTALKTALRKAGYTGVEDRIVDACKTALGAHPHDMEAAKRRAFNDMEHDALMVVFADFMNDALRPWFERARKEIGGGKGQTSCDTHIARAGAAAEPDRDGAGRAPYGAQTADARPAREPSAAQRNAMVVARTSVVHSIFDRELGLGGLIVGDATKRDFMNLRKKGLLVTAAADRFLTDIDWPDDDKTPLRKCASETAVKTIFDAAYRSMDAMGITNVGA